MKLTPFALFLLLTAVAGLALGVLQSQDYAVTWLNFFQEKQHDATRLRDELLSTAPGEIVLPAPLRQFKTTRGADLAAAGVLAETNKHRSIAQLPALNRNMALDAAAQKKLTDMFARQYFDHVSPLGVGPADLVREVNYQYLRVGENLALGNFASEADLVQAWMDSPGHRANILSPGFSEIGIAAAKGMYEGKETWLAAQTFGLPASVCPAPDESTRGTFEQQKEEATQTANALAARQADLEQRIKQFNDLSKEDNIDQETMEEQRTKLIAEQKQYNQAVRQFNSHQEETQQLADKLNKQIRVYNECAEKYVKG